MPPNYPRQGTRIAFHLDQSAAVHGLGIINTDNSGFWTPIPVGSYVVGCPVWLDENRIIYSQGTGSDQDLYLLDLRDLSKKQLTSSAGFKGNLDILITGQLLDSTVFDDFEDGNLNGWSVIGSTVTVSDENRFSGLYSLRLYDDTSVTSPDVSRSFNSNSSRVGVEFYEWTNDFGSSGGSCYGLETTAEPGVGWGLFFGAQAYTEGKWQYVNIQEKAQWEGSNLWVSNSVDFPVPVPALPNSWHKLRLEVFGPEGKARLWMDDSYKGEFDITPTQGPITHFWHGISWSAPTGTLNYIDDVRLYDLKSYEVPQITSVLPNIGPVGTFVTVSGEHFGAEPGVVSFNGISAAIGSWSDNQAVVTVPEGATTGLIMLRTSEGLLSNGLSFTVNVIGAPGSLQVTLEPTEVLGTGARWRLDGGIWLESGTTILDLAAGEHTISYLVVSGWTAPLNEMVAIHSGQIVSLSRSYSLILPPPGSFDLLAPVETTAFDRETPIVTLAWAASGLASSYEVYFGTNRTPDFHSSTSDTSVTIPVVPDQVYYWNVIARNDTGTTPSTNGPFSFGTGIVFASDFDDGTTQDWGFRDDSGLTMDQAKSAPYAIKVYSATAYRDEAECYRIFSPVAKGQAEFQIRIPAPSLAPVCFYLSEESQWEKHPAPRFWIGIFEDGSVKYNHNADWLEFSTSPTFVFDSWNKITIAWDSATDKLVLRINDVYCGVGLAAYPGGDITQLVFMKGSWATAGTFAYFDDIRVSITPEPRIISLVPDSGPVGTAVMINGESFGATQGVVSFNGVSAPITSWQDNCVVVNVPEGASTGEVIVHNAGGKQSNGVAFTVTAVVVLGSLQITLEPAEVVAAGAMWNVDGGAWQTTGALVPDLAPGSHTVYYQAAGGWTAPPDEAITIESGITLQLSRSYVLILPPPGAFDLSSPANVIAIERSTVSVDLTWNSSDRAASYDVYFGTTRVPGFHANTTGTSLSVTVAEDELYYWNVVAKNASGETPATNGPFSFGIGVAFFSDFDDSTAQGWGFRDQSGLTTENAHSTPGSIRNYSGWANQDEAECYKIFSPIEKGIADFWYYVPSSRPETSAIYLSDTSYWLKHPVVRFWLWISPDGTVKHYVNGRDWVDFPSLPKLTLDAWHQISLVWDTVADSVLLKIDGVNYGVAPAVNAGGPISQLVFMKANWSAVGTFAYVDDIQVSSTDAAIRKDDLVGTWDGQGVYYRDSDTGAWVQMASPATMITTGDIDDDGTDDLIGIWPSQGGVWVKYYATGEWVNLSSTAVYITTGDMNGDGRVDLLGTWDGQGVYYRDSATGAWVQMSSPASMITCGDLDDDGTDDLIGIWAGQGGVWVKYSSTGGWEFLGSTPTYIGAGDMNGDGRDELLGSWTGQGVYYRNSVTGAWVQMASDATMIIAGDLEGDGTDDLIGLWPTQGGIWVKYSSTGGWELLSSTARYIAAGKMRPAAGSSEMAAVKALPLPMGGTEPGPESALRKTDESSKGPGGSRFVYLTEPNLIPRENDSARLTRIPGPGEPQFIPEKQTDLFPVIKEKKRDADSSKENTKKKAR